jgi:hypothetical protein
MISCQGSGDCDIKCEGDCELDCIDGASCSLGCGSGDAGMPAQDCMDGRFVCGDEC